MQGDLQHSLIVGAASRYTQVVITQGNDKYSRSQVKNIGFPPKTLGRNRSAARFELATSRSRDLLDPNRVRLPLRQANSCCVVIVVVVHSYLGLWYCSSNYRPAECSGYQVVRRGKNRKERNTKDSALLGASLVCGYTLATRGPDIRMISSVGLCIILSRYTDQRFALAYQ